LFNWLISFQLTNKQHVEITYINAIMSFMFNMKKVIKKMLGVFFKSLPLSIRCKFIDGLTIFVFHEVSDNPSEFAKQHGLSISLDAFTQEIKWIESNFQIIHPSDLLSDTNIVGNTAIISFDDGFLGSFENGLAILEKMSIPSILFLNMRAILEKKPLLSATACYLDKYVADFSQFSKEKDISRPFHLTLTPSHLGLFESTYGAIDNEKILAYQGEFADLSVINKWDNNDLVVFGNHLFDHWNAVALSSDELKEQYSKNEIALSQFNNSINFFAFTNGQPVTCYTDRDITLLKKLGAKKIFTASGGVNREPANFLLRRMSLYEIDKDEFYIWFKLGKYKIIEAFNKYRRLYENK